MIFGEFSSLLSILESGKRLWTSFVGKKEAAEDQKIARRFIRLFEMHGVQRNQIPRFFDHGLTFAAVQDEGALMQVLSPAHLSDAAALFNVRLDWLEGATDEIYDLKYPFYKNPQNFAAFVEEVQARSEHSYGALLVTDVNKSSREERLDAFLVLAESIGKLGEEHIFRYHVCDEWVFNYWKSRAFLTACIAIAWKRNLYIHGKYVPAKLLQGVEERKALPVIESLKGKRWEPEYMALDPTEFLKGLDEGARGNEQGLNLWLKLDGQGWMDTGDNCSAKDDFSAALTGVVTTK